MDYKGSIKYFVIVIVIVIKHWTYISDIDNAQVSLSGMQSQMLLNVKNYKFAPIILRRRVESYFFQLDTVLSQ